MEMPEREHKPAYFIPDVEIPPDFKAVRRLQDDPKTDVNRERAPAETQMSIGIIHSISDSY